MLDGTVAYQVPVLRPHKLTITTIETVNNKIMNHMVKLAKIPGETQPDYFRRRAAEMANLKTEAKCCVADVWLKRLVSWCGHIFRHPALPLFRLWHIQTDDWLQNRRDSNRNRVDCREAAGFVSRWSEHWWVAVRDAENLGWAMRRGDTEEQLRRVNYLHKLIFGAPQQLELENGLVAIEDGDTP